MEKDIDLHIELIPPIKGDWSDKALITTVCPECNQSFSRVVFVDSIIPYAEIQDKCLLCEPISKDIIVMIATEWDK